MLLLKENTDIAPKDKMRFIINLWNNKKKQFYKINIMMTDIECH